MTVKTKFLALIFSLLLGITALILTLTLVPKSQETRRRAFDGPRSTCGDGICDDVTCMGIGHCPEPETPKNCPQDCLPGCRYSAGRGEVVCPTPTPTPTPSPTPSPTPLTLTGDINQDRIVDITDYSLFVGQFLHTGPGLTADFNQDSIVDVSDYSLLVANLLKTMP